MNKHLFLTAVASLLLLSFTHAQDNPPPASNPTPRTSDILSLGLGIGEDFGAFGGNITVYPQQNIGLFVGFGDAIAGFGYNIGVKIRALPNHGQSKVRPFFEAMYGYNAAVAVSNASQDNKLFYGPTVGAGLDIGSTRKGKGFLSLAILVPIRSPDVQNYIDQLRANGVSFPNDLLPITFSIGYHFILN